MRELYGVDTMPETGENVAETWNVTRKDPDRFALHSQEKAAAAQASGRFAAEIVPVSVRPRKGPALMFEQDEHSRATSFDALSALTPVLRGSGTVTAGNTSGLNDGAAAMLIA